MKYPTIDDVAAEAGVSRATVSRAINGGLVAAATRAHVLATAERLGYHPSQSARALASGRSGVIGVVLHQPVASLQYDWYTAGLYAGIAEELTGRGVSGVMQWFEHGSRSELLDAVVASHFVDGIVATTADRDDPFVRGLVDSGMPAVVIGNHALGEGVSFVDIDNRRGAMLAVEHLLVRGARRIGHITGERTIVAAHDRLDGYYAALDAAGVSERFVADGGFCGKSETLTAARELLAAGVDAVFAASDLIAAAVYEAATECGRSIPDDLLVVGFDDVPEADRMAPPLTTIHQDPNEQGAAAARLLLELITDGERRPRSLLIEPWLVERRSTGVGAAVVAGGS